jgi:hypothetical protein
MGFSLRKSVLLSAYAGLVLICSCDKHPVGEMPEVQREKGQVERPAATGASPAASPQTPASSPTPADFFPATKPE